VKRVQAVSRRLVLNRRPLLMPPTPKGPAAAAGLMIPCLGSVEGESGVPSRDWRPVKSVLRSRVWFPSFLSLLLRRSSLKHGGRLWRMRCLPRRPRPQSFSSSGIIYRLESAAFTVLFVSGRSRSSVSSLVMIGSTRRGLCGVGIVPLRLALPYQR